MKIKFEIKKQNNQNVIFINDESFDWQIEEDDLEEAIRFADNNTEVKKAIHADIKNFFLDCVNQVLNKEVTLKQINDALENGYIEL